MNQLELNIIDSFRRAKGDIIKIQSALTEISQRQEQLMALVGDNRTKETSLYQNVKNISQRIYAVENMAKQKVKVITREFSKPKRYLASKNGKKVHESNCPFAKNIKPKSKLVFKSKIKAFNAGYKACDCIKKV